MSGIEILVGDHRGQYIPQFFAEYCSIEILVGDHRRQYIPQFFAEYCSAEWDGIHPDDMQVLLEGPDNERYWETWDSVHTTAKHVDKNGNTWYLYQDGDLFAICEELMTDEERENFGFSDH